MSQGQVSLLHLTFPSLSSGLADGCLLVSDKLNNFLFGRLLLGHLTKVMLLYYYLPDSNTWLTLLHWGVMAVRLWWYTWPSWPPYSDYSARPTVLAWHWLLHSPENNNATSRLTMIMLLDSKLTRVAIGNTFRGSLNLVRIRLEIYRSDGVLGEGVLLMGWWWCWWWSWLSWRERGLCPCLSFSSDIWTKLHLEATPSTLSSLKSHNITFL